MGRPGVKPNEGQPRRNRNPPRHEWIEVENKPFEDPPPLPKSQTTGHRWPAQTKRWWHAVSTMPHCVLWDEADWQFALDTVLIAAAFHSGDMKQAVELRQREKVMGTTLDARRDLRIRYVEAVVEAEKPSLVAIQDYRRELEG